MHLLRFVPYISTRHVCVGGGIANFPIGGGFYFRLCRPILIDGFRKSLVLEKSTGKKCFMLSARELLITWGGDTRYWTWISHPVSRFEEVAKLLQVWWFDIIGRIRTVQLYPDTTYVVCFIFKLTEDLYGFNRSEHKASITTRDQHSTNIVCLAPSTQNNEETNQIPHVRADGWLEVVMGEFFNEAGGNEEEEVVVRLFETVVLNCKRGLIVEGIEFRPKN